MGDQICEQDQGHPQPEPGSIPCQDAKALDENVEQPQEQLPSEPGPTPCQDADDLASSEGENTLECERALLKFVICDEMPFSIVEGPGFQLLLRAVKPDFSVPSGLKVARDCFKLFLEESKKLEEFLEISCLGACLTAETWTSIRDYKYVSLTAHFIDEHWGLHKRMLNFCLIEDHEGDIIGRTIKKCLQKWRIKKLFTLTVEDASSDVITHLKKYLKDWNGLTCDGDYLHVRCFVHILNKVVNDGLRDLSGSISAIRNAIQYAKVYLEGRETFKRFVEEEKIEAKRLLHLGVVSRWTSIYMRLERAIKFQKVFERMESKNEGYKAYFNENIDKIGPPTTSDWSKVSAFVQVMKVFYDITLRLSRSLHATPNECFHDIALVRDMLEQNITHADPLIRDMAKNIKFKHDEYWGKLDNLNPLLVIGVILDPRYKLDYVKLIFENIYLDTEVCEAMKKNVKDTLYRLYEEYSVLVVNEPPENPKDNGESSRIDDAGVLTGPSFVFTNLKEKVLKKMRVMGDPKTELEKYLTADLVDDDPSFDILIWWKNNSAKYKVPFLIARDVLAVPASASSEYAFRPGERVLGKYGSYMSPRMVEALMCAKNWLNAEETVKDGDGNGNVNQHPELEEEDFDLDDEELEEGYFDYDDDEEPEEGDSDFNDDEDYEDFLDDEEPEEQDSEFDDDKVYMAYQ